MMTEFVFCVYVLTNSEARSGHRLSSLLTVVDSGDISPLAVVGAASLRAAQSADSGGEHNLDPLRSPPDDSG